VSEGCAHLTRGIRLRFFWNSGWWRCRSACRFNEWAWSCANCLTCSDTAIQSQSAKRERSSAEFSADFALKDCQVFCRNIFCCLLSGRLLVANSGNKDCYFLSSLAKNRIVFVVIVARPFLLSASHLHWFLLLHFYWIIIIFTLFGIFMCVLPCSPQWFYLITPLRSNSVSAACGHSSRRTLRQWIGHFLSFIPNFWLNHVNYFITFF